MGDVGVSEKRYSEAKTGRSVEAEGEINVFKKNGRIGKYEKIIMLYFWS